MRADARRNYDHLLAVAGEVIAEQGAEASLREIARRAEVGLGTMHRHFPTREALLEALLRSRLGELTHAAKHSEALENPGEGLFAWFRDSVTFVRSYSGVVDLMAEAIADPDSALHESCTALQSAGAALLCRAQERGAARTDIDGTDLFALMSALGWIYSQPSFASRGDHLASLVVGALGCAEFAED
jgi:AcrR family transcriptional regulator